MAEAANRQLDMAERQYNDYRTQDMPFMRELANRAIGISQGSADLARDQFGFSRNVATEQLAMGREQLGLTRSQVERANRLGDYQLEQMQFNDNRYRNTAIPFEDRLLEDVNRFDSASYKQGLIGQAQADVGSAFDRAGAESTRNMQRRGVNPNSGAALAMGNQNSMAKAMAMASAANKTRQAADQVGLSTKMQMYGGMRGLAGLGATNAGLATGAMGAGTSAIGTGYGSMNAGVGAMGIGNSALGAMQSGAAGMTNANNSYLNANNAAGGMYNQGMSSGIQGLGSYTQLGQRAAQINNEADPFASILGAGAQLGAAYLGRSDRRLKADIVHVGEDARTGLSLYEFRYTDGTQRFRGVMADEVLAKYPAAVVTMDTGYLAVNYTMLGLEMVAVEGEYA
jgi:hypothetical protein